MGHGRTGRGLLLTLAVLGATVAWAQTDAVTRALELKKAGDHQGAIAVLDKHLQANPQDAHAHYVLGWEYVAVEDDDKARYHFGEVVKLGTDAAEVAEAQKALARLGGGAPQPAGAQPAGPPGVAPGPAAPAAPAVPAQGPGPVAPGTPPAPMADAAPALPPAARAPGPGVLVAGLLAWAFCSFCLMRIAAATGAGGGWMAWIPILNLVLMLRIAGRPLWWIVLFFVPGVNIVVLVLVWMSVTTACGKSQWLGALAALIPPFGVLVLAYLAFTKPGDVRGDLLMTMPVSSVEGHALPEAITDKAPMPRDHAVVLVQFVALGAKETGHTGASDIAGALTQVIKLYRQGALIIVREGGEYKLFLRRGVRI